MASAWCVPCGKHYRWFGGKGRSLASLTCDSCHGPLVGSGNESAKRLVAQRDLRCLSWVDLHQWADDAAWRQGRHAAALARDVAPDLFEPQPAQTKTKRVKVACVVCGRVRIADGPNVKRAAWPWRLKFDFTRVRRQSGEAGDCICWHHEIVAA